MSGPPIAVRDELRLQLWSHADSIGWLGLTDRNRSEMYERWAASSHVGGMLARYMDARQVRVYIKDSLMKPYIRERMQANEHPVHQVLGVNTDAKARLFIKPHGKLLEDGRLFCWGASRDWKLILMSVYERSVQAKAHPFAAVFVDSGVRTHSDWPMITEAASRLQIERIEVLDAR